MGIGFKPKAVFDGDPEKPKKEKKKDKVVRKHSAKLKSEIIKRFEDDYDAIYEAYTNPKKQLTPTMLRQLARWKFARQWISDFEPPSDIEVVRALVKEFAVSQRQAYTDVANCKRMFASVTKVNQEFEKVMFIERCLRTRQKAMLLNNSKGFEVAAKYDVILAKVNGYDREQHENPEPVIVNVEVTTDLTAIGAKPIDNLAAIIKSFHRKKEEEKLREIVDVDYEDLLNNPRNESEHQK
jgi:hypothetical protein